MPRGQAKLVKVNELNQRNVQVAEATESQLGEARSKAR